MVQFGNVKPSIAVKDPTDLAEVAAAYLEACAKYKAAEEGYVAAKREGIKQDAAAPAPTDYKDRPATTPGPLPDDGDDVLAAAAETLAEGLGGVAVVEDIEAPWEKAEPQAQANPWDEGPVFDWS